MRKACGAISVVLVLLLPATMAATLTAKVEAVIDGDTFSIHTVSNLSYQVRLAGLDAPEEKQTFGGYALGALSEKILGKTVTVEHAAKDGDNPIIGQVRLGERWINLEMAAEGFAWIDSTHKTIPELAAAVAAARQERRGLWRDENPVPPWDWRRRDVDRRGRLIEDRPPANDDIVYYTETSNKYHRKGCRRLRTGVKKTTREHAEKWSLKPCPVCKP